MFLVVRLYGARPSLPRVNQGNKPTQSTEDCSSEDVKGPGRTRPTQEKEGTEVFQLLLGISGLDRFRPTRMTPGAITGTASACKDKPL